MEMTKIGKISDRQRFLPHSTKKVRELGWSTNNTVLQVDSDPKQLFGKTIFRPLRGAAASNFYTS